METHDCYFCQAIRSGDYYMFEELDEEVDLSIEEIEKPSEKRTFKEVGKILLLVTNLVEEKFAGDDIKLSDEPGVSENILVADTEPTVKYKNIFARKMQLLRDLTSNLLLLLAIKLHKISRSYSYVMKILDKEKKKLKVFSILFLMSICKWLFHFFLQATFTGQMQSDSSVILGSRHFLAPKE